MKNLMKCVFTAGLLTASAIASAQWTVGGGYANYSEDDGGLDISLGGVYGSAGYVYENGQISFMPELRIGVGVADDNVSGVNVEIDSFLLLSLRGQYEVTKDFSVFLQPTYGRLEVTANFNGQSASDDEWEFGFGGGAAFKVSDTTSIEAIYESFDGTDVLSLGVRIAL
jgi:opacity protein-like surface antigen